MMHADAHRSWSVRPLAETDLEAYLDIYLNSYPAYKDLDRACRGPLSGKAPPGAAGGHPDEDSGAFRGG